MVRTRKNCIRGDRVATMVQCGYCPGKGIIRRPKTGRPICKECFFRVFEDEIHQTITDAQLFKPGDRVAIAASGGKGIIIEFDRFSFSHHMYRLYRPGLCDQVAQRPT